MRGSKDDGGQLSRLLLKCADVRVASSVVDLVKVVQGREGNVLTQDVALDEVRKGFAKLV